MAMLAQLNIGCKSDDDTPDTPVPTNGETLTQADSLVIRQQMAVVNILSTLTGHNDIGADFDTQRYEPDYGTVRDEALPYVRAIAVADAAQAENQFLALGGAVFAVKTADGLRLLACPPFAASTISTRPTGAPMPTLPICWVNWCITRETTTLQDFTSASRRQPTGPTTVG